MRQLIIILTVCLGTLKVFAQTEQKIYLFPEFTDAIVYYKDGRAFLVPINYDLIGGQFIFIDKDKKKKEFSDPELVISVKINDRVFLPTSGGGAAEVIQSDPKLLVQYSGYARRKKNLPYGGKTETASVGTVSNLYSSASNSALDTEELVVTNINYEFHIETNKRMKKFSTEKQFLRIFPKQKVKLKQYMDENKIDFRSIEQIIKLCNYALSLN